MFSEHTEALYTLTFYLNVQKSWPVAGDHNKGHQTCRGYICKVLI